MAQGQRPSDDLARAVFSAADERGAAVPREQTTWLVNEVDRLVDDREIVGFADAVVAGLPGYVFAIIGDEAYLLRWDADDLEVSFLGHLPGLRYRERTHGIGAMQDFEGEPALALEVEHERLPGPMSIEVVDWQVGELRQLRAQLRSWAMQT